MIADHVSGRPAIAWCHRTYSGSTCPSAAGVTVMGAVRFVYQNTVAVMNTERGTLEMGDGGIDDVVLLDNRTSAMEPRIDEMSLLVN